MSDKAMLMLHGWGTHCGVFIKQMGAFKNEIEVFAPDYYDLMPDDTFSLDTAADALAGEIVDEGIKSLVILGWSFGGGLALKLCERLKDIAKGVILCGFSPVFVRGGNNPDGVPAGEIDKLKKRITESTETAIEEFVKLMMHGFVYTCHFEMIKELILDEISDEKKPLLLSSLDLLRDSDFTDDVKAITAPTLIIHGTEDKLCATAAAQRMAGLIDNARLKLIEGGSHIPFFTNAEEFNNTVKEFISNID